MIIKKFSINKNWRIELHDRENTHRPRNYLVVIGEFERDRPTVTDYPIHYNLSDNSIAYDCPERLPDFVKRKVAEIYRKFEQLRCQPKNYL